MNLLLVLPVIIPLSTAAAALLVWRWPVAQRVLGLIGTAALLAASLMLLRTVWTEGIQTVQIGDWPAPFGITLVADLFGAIMVVLGGVIGFAVAVYSLASMDPQREAFGYYPLLNVLLMGVCGAFLTGDLFNLYVWFEVLLMASFVLLALGGERAQMEGAIKYVTLNLISSALFLAALGILYGVLGTLNMAEISVHLNELSNRGLSSVLAMLFLVAFGIKAAVFPLFFWLPASYHTPPAAVAAVFAGLLTKVGVYALVRVFTLIFVQDVDYTHTLILIIAGLTMITGVLGAASQNEFRRILSFHIVSQIGYMIMGLGLFVPLAMAGTVFYIMHHIIVKTNLFLVAGIVQRLRGTYELKHLGGLYDDSPVLATLFMIPAMSLAGLPPLSGFFAKLLLVRAGLDAQSYTIVAVALLVSLLTLYSMLKIWAEAFWKAAPPEGAPRARVARYTGPIGLMYCSVVMLASLTVAIGLVCSPMLTLAESAAAQLLDPSQYVHAVLEAQP